MQLPKSKYILLEIIPTAMHPSKGMVIQLSALKLQGLELIERFDYRIEEKYIFLPDLKEMVSYDKEQFTYVDSSKKIMDAFKAFCEDFPLLIIDNSYTKNYLEDFSNKIESVFSYLDLSYKDSIIEDIQKKYAIEPTNHIVDILYEALLFKQNEE